MIYSYKVVDIMERKVVKIIKPDYSILKKIRVAIYCRVSTAHLDQMNSLENQIDYFKTLVKKKFTMDSCRYIFRCSIR